MPNELSEKVYPDGTVVKLRDDTAREQISGLIMHVEGSLSVTVPLSGSYTAAIFGNIGATPISAVVTLLAGGSVSITDLTSNSLSARANVIGNANAKTLTLSSKSDDKFYVNIVK